MSAMQAAKKVLVTGISGFTGYYIREEFLTHGWQVFGCGTRADLGQANYYQVDLLKPETLRPVIAAVQPDAVVHLAGIAFAAHRHPIDFYNTHVQGTLNLLEALSGNAAHLQKVLLVSTGNVYGNTVPGVYDESAALKPFNDYGASKLAMEYMAWLWRERLPIVITRPFNYTGVGQAAHFLLPKIINHVARRAPTIELGNLHVRRDYADVRNVATAYRRLVESSEAKGAINVCSGDAYSVNEVLRMVSEISGHTMSIRVNPDFVRPGEVDLLCGSHQKLEATVGNIDWIPLRDTLQWMLAAARSAS
jgi:nucleoside-diphosphate-sugar epimerase